MFGKRKVATLVAEFLGTGALTLLVLSVQRSTIGVPFFVAIAAGLVVALMVFALGATSGAHFNPAVTIGLWTARRISTISAAAYVAVQLLGGWAAYYLYTYLVNSTLQPVGGHFTGRVLVAEAVGAGVLAFGVAATVYQRFSTAVTASFSGLALTLGIVAASAASIGVVNPAVALGIRSWVWGTYVLGPIIGGVIGVNLYGLLFAEATETEAVAAVAHNTASAVTATTTFTKSAKVVAAKKAKAAPKKKTTTKKK